jgi:hypothetical protein
MHVDIAVLRPGLCRRLWLLDLLHHQVKIVAPEDDGQPFSYLLF